METQTSTASVGPIKDFKDLEVWQVARELRKEINRVASALSDFEKFALASQLRRAGTSVTANLAEGFGRFGYQENAQLCRQARGSLYEVRDHLTTCVDEGYLEVAKGETRQTGADCCSAAEWISARDACNEEGFGSLNCRWASVAGFRFRFPVSNFQFPISSF